MSEPHPPSMDKNPWTDPSQNVLWLVQSASQRQDDLRQAATQHQNELREMVAQHLSEVAQIRADLGKQLRDAESSRIDAIRAVDVGAVSRAAEVNATQAQTLATQVQVSAETLRGQVQAAANAATIALAGALEPIQKSIDDLRRVQYEQQGQRAAQVETKNSNSVVIGLAISTVVALISLIGLILVLIAP